MGAAGRAPFSPMSRQPIFASPAPPLRDRDGDIRMWMSSAENVDPNVDEAASRASPGTDCTSPSPLPTSVESAAHLGQRRRQALGPRSHSGASSMSSATKRLLEEEVERVEKRLRKEYEERLKQADARLAEEVKKREAAEKKAKRAVNKYHNQSRALTKWRIQAHRAKSALRNFWVRRADGTLARARKVLVQKGGKRRAIQRQVVIESGSLQPRKCGGTEYTIKERARVRAAACLSARFG